MEKRNLVGTKEISAYTGRSWNTVNHWIAKRNFPARKLDGVWMATVSKIDFWLSDQIEIAESSTK